MTKKKESINNEEVIELGEKEKLTEILYSNNALLLSMLCNVLSSTKLTDETENGIASITFILEQYIKKSIGKIFKGSISCQGVDIWKDTKRIAQWMYEHEEKRIDVHMGFLNRITEKEMIGRIR